MGVDGVFHWSHHFFESCIKYKIVDFIIIMSTIHIFQFNNTSIIVKFYDILSFYLFFI